MKKTLATLATLLGITAGNLKAQTLDTYLTGNLGKFETAKTTPEMVAASAQLDLAAAKWSDQWISNFYAAYSKICISFKLDDKTKRDQYLDAADAYLQKAEKLSPNNEEVLILQAWGAKARIAIDGKERWKKYGEAYNGYIEKAKKINAENPRIYFLNGQGPFYKPKMFGGGKDKAKPYFEKAKALFAKEDKTNIMVPSWGEKQNDELLQQCNE